MYKLVAVNNFEEELLEEKPSAKDRLKAAKIQLLTFLYGKENADSRLSNDNVKDWLAGRMRPEIAGSQDPTAYMTALESCLKRWAQDHGANTEPDQVAALLSVSNETGDLYCLVIMAEALYSDDCVLDEAINREFRFQVADAIRGMNALQLESCLSYSMLGLTNRFQIKEAASLCNFAKAFATLNSFDLPSDSLRTAVSRMHVVWKQTFRTHSMYFMGRA